MANIGIDIDQLAEELTEDLTEENEEDVPLLNGPFHANNTIVQTQMVLLNSIRKIVAHVVKNEQITFLVSFDTMAYGGNRWVTARCLYRRPELIVNYWNKKAIKEQRDRDQHNSLMTLSENTFAVYDF